MSNAVIFNGDYLKALKPKLKLAETAYIETGSADPTTLSLTSPVGSLYLRSNGSLYIKYGAGASAWAPALLTGTGSALTNTALTDDSVYFIDNLDNTRKMYFQLSSISSGQTRTLTIPDLSGTLPVGTGTTNYVTYWSSANQIAAEAQLSPSRGGTGSNNSGLLSYGSNNITLTTTGSTSLTLPTSGTLATLAGAEALTNKTINSSSIGSTTASSGAFTFLTVKGTGSAGTSYIDVLQESVAPSSPATSYGRIYLTTNVLNIKNAANNVFSIDYNSLTLSRTLTAPDRSSTIATLDGNQTFTGTLSLSTANLVSLVITGGLSIGNVTSAASVAGAGAIKYSTGFLYYSDGTNWTTLATYATSTYQNASFTAANNVNYFVDTSSGVVTATLPSGVANARIRFNDVKEKWQLNNFTITPASGQKIDNLATNESLIMDINGSWIELSWDTTTSSWVVSGSLAYGSSPTGFITHTGNSFGVDISIGTNDNYAFAFETNAIERMRIDTSGNLGIGTVSPTQKLHVNGNINVSDGNLDRFVVSFSSLNGVSLNNTQNSAMAFSTNNSEKMRITATGLVGIGTASPQASLDINGGFKASYDSYATNANLTKYNHFVIATAAITLNLPTLTSNDVGFTLYIKRVTAAGIVTINPGAGVTIDGSSTWPLTSNYESVKLVWRGSSDWSIF